MIAERIETARRDAGLTQAELATRIVDAAASDGEQWALKAQLEGRPGLDRSAIARWEAATFEPALRYRRYIARVLDRDRREMFPAVAAHEAA